MDSKMSIVYPHSLNKGFSSEFPIGYQDQYICEKGWRAQQPKCFDNNNKNEDNSPNINGVNNDNASFQKFRQKLFKQVA